MIFEAKEFDDTGSIEIKKGLDRGVNQATVEKIESLMKPGAVIKIFDSRGSEDPEDLGDVFMTSKVTKDGKMVKTRMIKGAEGGQAAVFDFSESVTDGESGVITEIFDSLNPAVVSILLSASSNDLDAINVTEGDTTSVEDALNAISVNEKVASLENAKSIDYTDKIDSFSMKGGVIERISFIFDFSNSILQSAAYKPVDSSFLKISFFRGESSRLGVGLQQYAPDMMTGRKAPETYDSMEAISASIRTSGIYGSAKVEGPKDGSADAEAKERTDVPLYTFDRAVKLAKQFTVFSMTLFEPLDDVIQKMVDLIKSNNYAIKIGDKRVTLAPAPKK